MKIRGRFSVTDENGEVSDDENAIERDVDGESYVFSTLYEGEEIGEISDGIFLFVLDTEAEAGLQKPMGEENVSICSGVNLLPSQIMAELYRTDDPTDPKQQRKTAETLWIHSPGGSELPSLSLQNDEVTE